MRLVVAVGIVCALGAAEARAAVSPNPWLTNRFLNIAHQGGELEAPSNTLYAFKSAVLQRGADEIELDVQLSSDGQLMVIHNNTVDATTEATGAVSSYTAAQLQALDAGYDFQWRTGHYSQNPARDFPFRGVRTGAEPPPAGYTAEDFRIPTMREVLNAFPATPINIEIKVPSAPQGIAAAEALAALLNEPAYAARRDIIVVSFQEAPLERFHELAPSVYLAPAEDALLDYASGQPLDPDPAVFEVPTTYNLGGNDIDVPDLLLNTLKAHEKGYAVHVFLDPGEDNDAVYARLVGQGVDGIMSNAPGRLANYLCRANVRRPGGGKRCASQPDQIIVSARDKLDHDFAIKGSGLGKALKRGLVVNMSCSLRCRVALKLQIGPGVAKRADLGSKRRTVGQATIGLSEAGTQRIRLRFSKGVRDELATLSSMRVSVLSTPVAAGGDLDEPVRHALKLSRPKK